MKMNKRERSFIELANNAAAKSVPVALEEPEIPSQFWPGLEQAAVKLAQQKKAALESMAQENAIARNEEIKLRLAMVVSSISEKGAIEEGEDLRFLLNVCNAYPNKTFDFKDGKVVMGSGYLMVNTSYAIRDLFEFLSKPKNIKKIKKCPDCLKLFVSVKNNPRQKYCSVCSKKNHTPKEEQAKRTRTSREAAKKRKDTKERKTLFLMQYERNIQAGYTKKQAEQEAKEYVIEQMGVIE